VLPLVLKGKLLVATPPLADPNFDRTVVLLLEHSDGGALGVVLNRPSDRPASDVLPAWESQLVEPDTLFHGGPVEVDAVVGLAPVTGSVLPAVVDLSVEPDDQVPPCPCVRLFHGYAGWGPGQLEGELEAGAWLVVDPVHDDPFTTDPAGLWRAVLRRQPGRLAWLAQFPDDVHAN